MGTQGAFVEIGRYLLPEGVPQELNPGDLLVSGMPDRRFLDVARGVHFTPLSQEIKGLRN